jgi:hypothetical protein
MTLKLYNLIIANLELRRVKSVWFPYNTNLVTTINITKEHRNIRKGLLKEIGSLTKCNKENKEIFIENLRILTAFLKTRTPAGNELSRYGWRAEFLLWGEISYHKSITMGKVSILIAHIIQSFKKLFSLFCPILYLRGQPYVNKLWES